jgi:hypothetical protein
VPIGRAVGAIGLGANPVTVEQRSVDLAWERLPEDRRIEAARIGHASRGID